MLVVALFSVGCVATGDEPAIAEAQSAHCSSAAIITEHHFINVPNGATLHVVEKRSQAALHRHHRRAILMLPATLVTNVIWNADVPGTNEYNGLERAAEEGFLSYTLDYEGYGQSSQPADGKDVDAARLLEDTARVVKWIRNKRGVKKVDLLGSSLGSTLALMLGSKDSPLPRGFIGRVVITANVYANVTPMAAAAMLSPEAQAFFMGLPGGYIDTAPPMYGVILAGADPAAADYCFQNCPGHYAVGPTLEGFELPTFDAHRGRAPVLQFWGDQDMITPWSDVQQFQSDYGGSHALVVLNGGAHVPQWESVRDQFWANTFAFLGDDGDDDDDDD